MSTRGAIGFQYNNELYTTYNHSDSYPSWLGNKVLGDSKDIISQNLSISDIKNKFDNFYFVEDEDEVTEGIYDNVVSKILHYDASIIGKTLDFYKELRDWQGELKTYFDNGIMIGEKNSSFMEDSLFCEWAYILNFDTKTLDVYRGFQKSPPTHGYYSNKNEQNEENKEEYYPCDLLTRFSFEVVKEIGEDSFQEHISKCLENGFSDYEVVSIDCSNFQIENS